MQITESLKHYIDEQIIPRYDHFDAAHRRDHAETVITQSMLLAENYEVNVDMVYAIAAYHDTGLCEDRKTHHLVSGRIVRLDEALRKWFGANEIETMAQAVEDHRASSDHAPRSIYGMIVAEADRAIVPHNIVERTIQYGLSHYPELDEAEQYERTLSHLKEKYGDGGYLKLWLPDSPHVARLEELRSIIRNDSRLRKLYDEIYESLKTKEA